MKSLKLLFLCLINNFVISAQTATKLPAKSTLDLSVFDKWSSVGGAVISNDGRYVYYTINNRPLGIQTIVLQSTDGQWRIELQGLSKLSFTDNSREIIFKKSGDSLCLLKLGSNVVQYIAHVSSYELTKQLNHELLIYQLNSPERKLIIRNLDTGKETPYPDIANYWISKDGKALVVETASKDGNSKAYSLSWLNLIDGDTLTFWNGAKTVNLVFDGTGTKVSFAVSSNILGNNSISLWLYQIKSPKCVLLAADTSGGINKKLKITGICSPGFSKDGNRVFFTLKEYDRPKPKMSEVKVDVYSYKDFKLQSEQLQLLTSKSYISFIRIEDQQIIQLSNDIERISLPNNIYKTGEYAFLINEKASNVEASWNLAWAPPCIISTKDGRKIWESKLNFYLTTISPEEKYIVYYDLDKKNYFCYEISSKNLRNITQDIPTIWSRNDDNVRVGNYPVAGWSKGDNAVFLYDQNDIWQIDLAGKKQPINLTNGYGRKNNIVFRFLAHSNSIKIYDGSEKVILSAFNTENKNNGFFEKALNRKGDPELLSMGPYLYFVPDLRLGDMPTKARDSRTWIVTRMSATESPNYYLTIDFKKFNKLSNVHPEKDFNWIQSELHTWTDSNGSLNQGILYKPENFDSQKVYPIIIHYYEKKSDQLNLYIQPQPCGGDLNIPWFVSHGYLVFEPDIYYQINYPGESALRSVLSAAKYLGKKHFVDSKKIGIQGHSFGGFETNYIVTHSNLFAAACASSAPSDLISGYGSIEITQGISLQHLYELGQFRIGFTLWQRPDLYIQNSSVFQVDKVTTPLLIMHTKNDGVVLFSQAVEFFTALRRLGKKAWMLQYDCCDHSLDGASAYDFTVRITQFFDYYLKGAPAPIWMTRGIPAKMKGIEDGLELDSTDQLP